uniref:Uncharacterized protein n=1 Tax=viral metagenome TaxID=1070528 RepID=A0A6C0BQA5_9ZZZZ
MPPKRSLRPEPTRPDKKLCLDDADDKCTILTCPRLSSDVVEASGFLHEVQRKGGLGVCFHSDHKHKDGWVTVTSVAPAVLQSLNLSLTREPLTGTLSQLKSYDMVRALQYLDLNKASTATLQSQLVQRWSDTQDVMVAWDVFQALYEQHNDGKQDTEKRLDQILHAKNWTNLDALLDLELKTPVAAAQILSFARHFFGTEYRDKYIPVRADTCFTLNPCRIEALAGGFPVQPCAIYAGGSLCTMLDPTIPMYPSADVDIFLLKDEDPQPYVEALMKAHFVVGQYGPSVIMAVAPHAYTVQIIASDAKRPVEIVSRFDFGHNMIFYHSQTLYMNLLALEAWSTRTLKPSISAPLPRNRYLKAHLKGFPVDQKFEFWELQQGKYHGIPKSATTADEIQYWLRKLYRITDPIQTPADLRPLRPLMGHLADYQRETFTMYETPSSKNRVPIWGLSGPIIDDLPPMRVPFDMTGYSYGNDKNKKFKLTFSSGEAPGSLRNYITRALPEIKKHLSQLHDEGGEWPFKVVKRRYGLNNYCEFMDLWVKATPEIVWEDEDGQEMKFQPQKDLQSGQWFIPTLRPLYVYPTGMVFRALRMRAYRMPPSSLH